MTPAVCGVEKLPILLDFWGIGGLPMHRGAHGADAAPSGDVCLEEDPSGQGA